jgi:hypothetical protein
MSEKAPVQQLLPESVRSDKFVSFYSNNTFLDVTPWDFKFIFGSFQKSETPGKMPRVENMVEIIMSPQHAKALLGVLNHHVQEYEKQIGEIKLPMPGPQPEAESAARKN